MKKFYFTAIKSLGGGCDINAGVRGPCGCFIMHKAAVWPRLVKSHRSHHTVKSGSVWTVVVSLPVTLLTEWNCRAQKSHLHSMHNLPLDGMITPSRVIEYCENFDHNTQLCLNHLGESGILEWLLYYKPFHCNASEIYYSHLNSEFSWTPNWLAISWQLLFPCVHDLSWKYTK